MQTETPTFRDICVEHGIAVTHQRQVIYETMKSMMGHPSPEEVYDRVRKRIPAVSLATVYKNLHLFIESGVLREVSMHHGTLRVEMNGEEHHHMVCSECKKITDIDDSELGLTLEQRSLPGGFVARRYAVDIIGICAECQAKQN